MEKKREPGKVQRGICQRGQTTASGKTERTHRKIVVYKGTSGNPMFG